MPFPIRAFAVLLLCVSVPAFADDLTITSKVTRDGGAPETKVSYISSDHVRMVQGDGNELILDLRNGQMISLSSSKKTYYVVTREDMDAMAARMQEQMNSPEMQRAQEQMKNLPPEVREKMGALGAAFSAEVQDLGTTRRIAGYKCENWKVAIGQFSRTEECLTTELKYPVQAWNMYRSYADSLKNMMAALGPMASNMGKMMEQLKKLKGFPLASTTTSEIMGRRSVTTSEVTEVKTGSIPASVWEIPAGYTRVDSPMQKALARQKR